MSKEKMSESIVMLERLVSRPSFDDSPLVKKWAVEAGSWNSKAPSDPMMDVAAHERLGKEEKKFVWIGSICYALFCLLILGVPAVAVSLFFVFGSLFACLASTLIGLVAILLLFIRGFAHYDKLARKSAQARGEHEKKATAFIAWLDGLAYTFCTDRNHLISLRYERLCEMANSLVAIRVYDLVIGNKAARQRLLDIEWTEVQAVANTMVTDKEEALSLYLQFKELGLITKSYESFWQSAKDRV